MRTAIIAILIFLWAICFELAKMNYGEGFTGTREWNTTGWMGYVIILISASFLFQDWLNMKKKSGKK